MPKLLINMTILLNSGKPMVNLFVLSSRNSFEFVELNILLVVCTVEELLPSTGPPRLIKFHSIDKKDNLSTSPLMSCIYVEKTMKQNDNRSILILFML